MGDLDLKSKNQIQSFLGWPARTAEFKLIWKWSTEPVKSSAAWHTKVNDVGPTVSVIYLTNGFTFGGYTTISWTGTGYKGDAQAFIFRLVHNGAWLPYKFPVGTVGYAIYAHPGHGPTFGNHAMHVNFDTIHTSYSNTAQSYVNNLGGDHKKMLAGQYNGWSVREVETYIVTQLATPRPIGPRYRIDLGRLQTIRNGVNTYSPRFGGDLNTPITNIIVLAAAGAGKTSSYNNLISAMKNDGDVIRVGITKPSAGQVTTKFVKIDPAVYMTTGKFALYDTWGWDSSNYQVGEIGYMLDGNISPNFEMSPDITPESQGFVQNPTYAQRMHFAMLIVPAGEFNNQAYFNKFKVFLKNVEVRKMRHMILMTKCDLQDAEVRDDPSKLCTSEIIAEQRVEIARRAGLEVADVWPVINYPESTETTPEQDYMILRAMRHALSQADIFHSKVKSGEIKYKIQ
eukprot:TRINITY_DN2855_c0_g1_i1.p1 TRINITY_DN2855_c0_g1~~TRINITY_DN2855_c0_g1_i1.p1  ORF type:complete len:455 (-),score=50.89 TRINITY_DN2855_c0_g1_i1:31-1395(-)